MIEPGEHCDDGGTVSGDGCDSLCQDETINGPTISLVPVGASGVHTIEGNEIILYGGDQTVRLEIRLDNWDPVTDVGLCPDQTRCSVSQQDCAVGVCEQATGLLATYQARIDSAGYAGILAPPVIPCTTKLDCEVFGSPSSHSGPPCDTASGTCGPDASGFIDPEHGDYVFSGHPVIAPVNNIVDDWSYATLVMIQSDAPPYAGMDKYAGTLVLNAPAHASGSFTIGFVNDPRETFMHDANGATIFPVRTIPAIITVQPDAIPTVSDWGLIVLVLLLLAVGTVSIRRRRHYGINVF